MKNTLSCKFNGGEWDAWCWKGSKTWVVDPAKQDVTLFSKKMEENHYFRHRTIWFELIPELGFKKLFII